MIDILVTGCFGTMGKTVVRTAAERNELRVVAGIDCGDFTGFLPFPVYKSFDKLKEKPQIAVDFSKPELLDSLLSYCTENKIPAVIATTGYSDKQIEKIKAASKEIPLFFTANMSIGINLLSELAKKAALVLYPEFNIEIVEEHHNQKVDAPSGTALMLADEIASVLNDKLSYVYERHSERKKRAENEIGIHSIRGGSIVGRHEIIFAGNNETLRLSHSAASKQIFATGALNAAVFLSGKEPGLYNMKDMLK